MLGGTEDTNAAASAVSATCAGEIGLEIAARSDAASSAAAAAEAAAAAASSTAGASQATAAAASSAAAAAAAAAETSAAGAPQAAAAPPSPPSPQMRRRCGRHRRPCRVCCGGGFRWGRRRGGRERVSETYSSFGGWGACLRHGPSSSIPRRPKWSPPHCARVSHSDAMASAGARYDARSCLPAG